MRVTDLFETVQSKEELDRLLKTYFYINSKIIIEYHDDGSISVDGDVILTDESITYLPVKFHKVNGHFYCSHTNLTSLEGSPQEVGGSFSCYDTKITSLEGSPQEVGRNFDCDSTKIISLKGGPKKVGSEFYCYGTKRTSLEGNFYCYGTKITSLEGAPEYVGGYFHCENTPFYERLLDDENTQISAVRYLPKQFIKLLIRNIKITQSVQIIAVDTAPEVIQYIKNPTRMAQLTAVKKNPNVIKFIENPDPLVLQYLAKHKLFNN